MIENQETKNRKPLYSDVDKSLELIFQIAGGIGIIGSFAIFLVLTTSTGSFVAGLGPAASIIIGSIILLGFAKVLERLRQIAWSVSAKEDRAEMFPDVATKIKAEILMTEHQQRLEDMKESKL